MEDQQFQSLAALDADAPDHHHWSTVDNLSFIYSASDALECWREEHVSMTEIDLLLLHDDPADVDGDTKIESIRGALRAGGRLPAVILIHGGGDPPYAYRCLEGKHRYNAVYREGLERIHAWVAHVGCCGGPDADLTDEDDQN